MYCTYNGTQIIKSRKPKLALINVAYKLVRVYAKNMKCVYNVRALEIRQSILFFIRRRALYYFSPLFKSQIHFIVVSINTIPLYSHHLQLDKNKWPCPKTSITTIPLIEK
jgi:hypothetical protein